MKLKIVTDSTCDLPDEVAAENGISVVPVYINIEGQSYQDGVDLSRSEYYTHLPEYAHSPTTAAPGISAFAEVYEQAANEGYEGVVSIHVAESLSATINAARKAKDLISRIPVWVVDSGQISLGLGLQAVEAARAALHGLSVEEIINTLSGLRKRTYLYAVVDTLEFLRRSGRVARYRAILGSMVKIKPIVSFHDSVIKLEMALTTGKAFKRIQEIVANLAPLERMSFVHILAQSRVDELQQLLKDFIPQAAKTITHEVTPAIGTHIGPGAAGVVFVRT